MLKKIFGRKKKESAANVSLDITKINKEKLPRHVAIIMDGNGRWAKGKGLVRTAGHKAGVKTLKNILKTASKIGIEVLTVYAFSTENWKRPKQEVDFLMRLFSEYLDKEVSELHAENVKVRFIGRHEGFSSMLQDKMSKAEKLTENNSGIIFNVAANYGGQDEILRAMKNIGEKIAAGVLTVADIDEDLLESELDTAGNPPVDLVIRTSGDMRLSNFLLWQSAYAEFWFTDINWPDFSPECFLEAISDYANRERRFGGLKENK